MRLQIQTILLALFLIGSPSINLYPKDDASIISDIEADKTLAPATHLLKKSDAKFEMSCTWRLDSIDYAHFRVGTGTAVGIDLSGYEFDRFNPKKSKRYLLTAAHCVCTPKDVVVDTLLLYLPNSLAKCHVIKIDTQLDLAILQCNEDLPAQAKLDDTPIAAGLLLVNVGCPHGLEPRAAAGLTIMEYDDNKWYASATGYTHGCSGGPFFHNGKIAGISVQGLLDPKDAYGEQKMHEGIGIFVITAKIKEFISAKK